MGKKVKINIRKLVKEKGISLRELSRETDIRHATLSQLANGKRQRIQFSHIESIAEACDIDDIREIIEIINIKD